MSLTARRPSKFEKHASLPLGADPRAPEFSGWPASWAQRSRELWAQLHRRALQAEENDTEWLTAFAYRLPCAECRSHFWALVLASPPVWGNGFFGWTVRLHNSVNLKLRKPLMAEADARTHWSEPGERRGAGDGIEEGLKLS